MHLQMKFSMQNIVIEEQLTGQKLLSNLDGLRKHPVDDIWVRTPLEVAE